MKNKPTVIEKVKPKDIKKEIIEEFGKIWEVIYTYDRDTAEGHNAYRICTKSVEQFLSKAIDKAIEEERVFIVDMFVIRLTEWLRR